MRMSGVGALGVRATVPLSLPHVCRCMNEALTITMCAAAAESSEAGGRQARRLLSLSVYVWDLPCGVGPAPSPEDLSTVRVAFDTAV